MGNGHPIVAIEIGRQPPVSSQAQWACQQATWDFAVKIHWGQHGEQQGEVMESLPQSQASGNLQLGLADSEFASSGTDKDWRDLPHTFGLFFRVM